jgi:cyanate permease
VLAGGVLAGVIGPQTVIFSKDLFEPISFAGAYLAQSALGLVAFAILAFLRIPRAPLRRRAATDRSIATILSQPRIVVAIVCGVISYSVMSLVMTAAPLAIVACGFSTDEAALGIQWHVLAMFGPSFVTGSLIARFGAPRITFIGLVLLIGSGAVALAGIELAHFWISLILLGLGWNFGFIGATSMLTEAQRPEEKARLQAANDLLVFGFVALASLSSGAIFNHLGWDAVVWVAVPMVATAALTLGWLALSRRRLKAA